MLIRHDGCWIICKTFDPCGAMLLPPPPPPPPPTPVVFVFVVELAVELFELPY